MLRSAEAAEKLWTQAYSELEDAPCGKSEFDEYFSENGYARSGSELSAEVTAALLSVMELSSTDRFVDFGSSEGRVPLAAGLLTRCGSSVGIELSPSRHAVAIMAQKRLHDLGVDAGASPHLGDFLDEEVLSTALPTAATGTPPLRDVIWYTAGAGSTVDDGVLDDVGAIIPLFGKGEADSAGPRMVLEYHVHGR